MTTTNNLNINLVEQSQAQKEVTINEALYALEALQNRGAEDKDLSVPPGSPSDGDTYIIAASATGDWETHDDEITYYNNNGWHFISPNEGLMIWVKDENVLYCYNGTSWTEFTGGTDLSSITELGVNATPDVTNRLSVASDAVLFNHDGDDVRTKLNKNSSTDTASFIFQDNFSGRAEFGLIGDDDFTLKVSDDGSTWNDALTVDDATGDVSFNNAIKSANGITFDNGSNVLDKYEFGMWTPTIMGASTTGTPTYTSATNGFYTRVGDLVFVTGIINISSKGGMTGDLRMNGLPYDLDNSTAQRVGASVARITGLNLSGSEAITFRVVQNTDRMDLYRYQSSGAGSTELDASEINDTFYITFSFTYVTDE